MSVGGGVLRAYGHAVLVVDPPGEDGAAGSLFIPNAQQPLKRGVVTHSGLTEGLPGDSFQVEKGEVIHYHAECGYPIGKDVTVVSLEHIVAVEGNE